MEVLTVVSWFNNNSGFVQAVLVAVLVAVTASYAYLTHHIARATREQAEATRFQSEATREMVRASDAARLGAFQPRVVAGRPVAHEFSGAQDQAFLMTMSFRLTNTGRGSASSVSYEFMDSQHTYKREFLPVNLDIGESYDGRVTQAGMGGRLEQGDSPHLLIEYVDEEGNRYVTRHEVIIGEPLHGVRLGGFRILKPQDRERPAPGRP